MSLEYEPASESKYEPASEPRYEPASESKYEPTSEPNYEPSVVTQACIVARGSKSLDFERQATLHPAP